MSNVTARTNEAIQAFLRWLEIREAWGAPFPKYLGQLRADADHSALLQRLLEGKDPFPEPPPRSHSYPNYNLLERGFDDPLQVYELEDEDENEGMPVLVIDQAIWKIVEKLGPEEWIAAYEVVDQAKLRDLAHAKGVDPASYVSQEGSRDLPMRLAESRWRVSRVGARDGVDPSSSLSKTWSVERYP